MQQRLNPRQVIFGKYLEMSAPEIEEEVHRALDENPALEIISDRSDSPSDESVAMSDDGYGSTFGETADQLQRADYPDDDETPPAELYRRQSHDPYPGSEYLSDTSGTGLFDSLETQLAELHLTPVQRTIATYIIGNLDANGYMTRSLSDIKDDIAIAEGIDPSLPEVKDVFSEVRRLDPAGIGAVDLRDCLLLQIDRLPVTLTSKIAREIVADWFDLFAKKHFDQITARIGIDANRMQDALDLIRTLNPKPGALLEGPATDDRLRHIIPDFAVEVSPDGVAHVSLVNSVPELAIEQSFDIDNFPVSDKPSRQEKDAMAFVRRRHDDAASFISLLRMRAETLLSVMNAIVAIQHDFFQTGDRSMLHPMIIKDVSARTGLDISVISRAAAGKYVMTPFGVFPLKMFFNERPKDDSDASSHQILQALTDIIDKEDKLRPYSDDTLCRLLADRGFNLARRTVTKYRERLGIPVARLRKSFRT